MCEVLQLPRSTYYYETKERNNQEEILTMLIVKIFKDSRNIYGQRKIKVELEKLGWQISRRRIGRIMKQQGLVSKYTVARSEEHTSELQSRFDLVCRLLLEKKKKNKHKQQRRRDQDHQKREA